MGLPERVGVVMVFQRGSSRLHFELWTTPVGDQLRSYMDGAETYARIIRDGEGRTDAVLEAMRQRAIADGWTEEPPGSA